MDQEVQRLKDGDIMEPKVEVLGKKEEEKVREESVKSNDKEGFVKVGGKYLFAPGHNFSKKGKRKKKTDFSIREDLIKSLQNIKKKKPALYKEIIASYWEDKRLRQFLLEIVDGKARQSMSLGGIKENPVKIIQVKEMESKE